MDIDFEKMKSSRVVMISGMTFFVFVLAAGVILAVSLWDKKPAIERPEVVGLIKQGKNDDLEVSGLGLKNTQPDNSSSSYVGGDGVEAEYSCPVKKEKRIVRGDSMKGIVPAGTEVVLELGYYECNEISRGDLVVYNYMGNIDPIIKVAKGVPGDKFGLELVKDKGQYKLLINGSAVFNSENKEYMINSSRAAMLNLYIKDYNGVIPANAYIILGDNIAGSADSTQFGLVGKKDILGRVVKASK